MKLPRDLDGRTLINILCHKFDYRVVHQVGSHVVLETETPAHQRISIPDHHPLRIGTLNSILRLVEQHKGISRQKVIS